MSKHFVLVTALALMIGCTQQPKPLPIPTPAREVNCPICLEPALLKQFTTYDADYECPSHEITFSRRDGTFDRARPKYILAKESK